MFALGVMGRLGICPCVATAGSCSHVMVTRRCEMSSEQNKSVTAGRRGTRDMFRRGLSLGASHAQLSMRPALEVIVACILTAT